MREIKGLDGSNPPISATESVMFTYNLEMAVISRGAWRFFARSAPEKASSGRIRSM